MAGTPKEPKGYGWRVAPFVVMLAKRRAMGACDGRQQVCVMWCEAMGVSWTVSMMARPALHVLAHGGRRAGARDPRSGAGATG